MSEPEPHLPEVDLPAGTTSQGQRVAWGVLGVLLTLATFYYIAKLVKPSAVGARDQYFAFAMIGILTTSILTSASFWHCGRRRPQQLTTFFAQSGRRSHWRFFTAMSFTAMISSAAQTTSS